MNGRVLADPVLPAEADFPQGARAEVASAPAAGERCHGTGAGACVSRTVSQGHNVSLLDVLAIEIRDAASHRWCLLVLELNGYYM